MSSSHLPGNSATLFADAEELANVLGDNHHTALRIEPHAEARLRASLAAATYAREAYLALRAAAGESETARNYLMEARTRCVRTEHQLRRRMAQLIAALSMHLDPEDSPELADYVFSVGA